jgi:hypothetical protein
MRLGKDDVAFLESMDMPTVCNVIESPRALLTAAGSV